jgi:hypothetical protein
LKSEVLLCLSKSLFRPKVTWSFWVFWSSNFSYSLFILASISSYFSSWVWSCWICVCSSWFSFVFELSCVPKKLLFAIIQGKNQILTNNYFRNSGKRVIDCDLSIINFGKIKFPKYVRLLCDFRKFS